MRGSPLNSDILKKANIKYADKVVILGNNNDRKEHADDEMLDADSIYIY